MKPLPMPGLLAKNGYHAACIGKWHLGRQWPRAGKKVTARNEAPRRCRRRQRQHLAGAARLVGGPASRGRRPSCRQRAFFAPPREVETGTLSRFGRLESTDRPPGGQTRAALRADLRHVAGRHRARQRGRKASRGRRAAHALATKVCGRGAEHARRATEERRARRHVEATRTPGRQAAFRGLAGRCPFS